MSRIDKALRRLGGLDPASVTATPPDTGTALSDVRARRRPGAANAGNAARVEPERRAVAVPSGSVRPSRSPKVDPDLEARLVTARLSPVSLEQYRRVAAALHDAQTEGGLKTVMITSAVAARG